MENIDVKEGFIVDSDAKADWCLDKIRKAREQQERNAETAKAILERKKAEVEEWLAEQNAEAESTVLRMQAMLEPYIQEKLRESKKKSLKLPSGSAGYRSVAPTFQWNGKKIDTKVKNENQFCAAVGNLDYKLVDVRYIVRWDEQKKRLVVADNGTVCTDDGQIIDGLTAVQHPDRFYVS